jgi:hypothetical protein
MFIQKLYAGIALVLATLLLAGSTVLVNRATAEQPPK